MSALRTLQRTSTTEGGVRASKLPTPTKLKAHLATGVKTDENAGQTLTRGKPRSQSVSVACQTTSERVATVFTTEDTNTDVSIAPDSPPPQTVEEVKRDLFAVEPSLAYWRALAERLQADYDTQIADNFDLVVEVANLRERNVELTALAEESAEYVKMIKECLGEEAEEKKEN